MQSICFIRPNTCFHSFAVFGRRTDGGEDNASCDPDVGSGMRCQRMSPEPEVQSDLNLCLSHDSHDRKVFVVSYRYAIL